MKNIKKSNKIVLMVVSSVLIILVVILGAVFYSRAHGDDYKFNQDGSLKTQYYKDYNTAVTTETENFDVLDNEEPNYSSLVQQVKSLIKNKYPKWNDIVTVDFKNKDGTALKGKWAMGDNWDWIAYKETNIDAKWVVLISFDGFTCKQVDNIPKIYDSFFKDKVYMFGSKYCYNQ